MSNSPIKEPSPIKRISNTDGVNNTYLNMNVNMNVVNPPSNNYFIPNIQFTNNNVTPLTKPMRYSQQIPMYPDMYTPSGQHYEEYEPEYVYEQQYAYEQNPRGYQQQPFNPNFNPHSTRNNRHNNQAGYMRQMEMKNSLKPSFMEFSDDDLAKYANNLAKDQAGCRYLQKRIDDNPDIVNTLIYPNVGFYFIFLDNRQCD
jgi:hypothetical protein